MRELPSLRTISKIWAINHIDIKKHIALIKESTQNGRFDVKKLIALLEKSVQNNELDEANLWTDKEGNLLPLALLDELNLWENKDGNLLPLYDACRLPAEDAKKAEIEKLVHYHITQLPKEQRASHLNMAFLFAARNGQINTVKKLLELGTNMQAIFNYAGNDLTLYNNIQRYPLPGAKDQMHITDFFYYNPNRRYGDIAVLHAAIRNQVNIVALLLKEGESKDTKLSLSHLIEVTVQYDAPDALNYLLNETNRLNKELTPENLTTLKQEAIEKASKYSQIHILLALVDQLRPEDVKKISPNYYAATLKAIHENQADKLKQLLKYTSNHPNPPLTTSDLAKLLNLTIICSNDSHEMTKVFLDNAQNLTTKGIDSALTEAAFFHDFKIAITLLGHGANASFSSIKTAVKSGATKITHLLLLKGAAPTLQEKKILIEKAKKHEHPKIEKLLKKWIKWQKAVEQQAAERRRLIPSNMMGLFATTNTSDHTTGNTPKSDNEEKSRNEYRT